MDISALITHHTGFVVRGGAYRSIRCREYEKRCPGHSERVLIYNEFPRYVYLFPRKAHRLLDEKPTAYIHLNALTRPVSGYMVSSASARIILRNSSHVLYFAPWMSVVC